MQEVRMYDYIFIIYYYAYFEYANCWLIQETKYTAQNEQHKNPSWFFCDDVKQAELFQSRIQ